MSLRPQHRSANGGGAARRGDARLLEVLRAGFAVGGGCMKRPIDPKDEEAVQRRLEKLQRSVVFETRDVRGKTDTALCRRVDFVLQRALEKEAFERGVEGAKSSKSASWDLWFYTLWKELEGVPNVRVDPLIRAMGLNPKEFTMHYVEDDPEAPQTSHYCIVRRDYMTLLERLEAALKHMRAYFPDDTPLKVEPPGGEPPGDEPPGDDTQTWEDEIADQGRKRAEDRDAAVRKRVGFFRRMFEAVLAQVAATARRASSPMSD